MTNTMLVSILAAACGGFAAGGVIPDLGEWMMARKAGRREKKYPVYGNSLNVKRWYAFGLSVIWMVSATEPVILNGIFFALVSALMLMVTYVDIQYRIIANESNVVLLCMGLLYVLVTKGLSGLAGSLAAMAAGIAVCLLAAVLTRGKGVVGAGDMKLMAACCCMAGMPDFISVLFYMSISMGLYCVMGLKMRRLTLHSYFPMGGFIAIGLILSFYTNQIQAVIRLSGL